MVSLPKLALVVVAITGCAGGQDATQPVCPQVASAPLAVPTHAPIATTATAVPTVTAPATAPKAPPQPNWTTPPTGSTTLVFREAHIGALAARGRRFTWTLIRAGSSVLLRVEAQSSLRTIHDLESGSLSPDQWGPPERTEYAGSATGSSMQLARTFGELEPKELPLTCTNKSIDVHSAFVTLVKGWRRNDESMQPASWAPPRVDRIPVLNCKDPKERTSNISDGLSFAKPKHETPQESEMVGVEWVFVNSDMVIQQGGYRWLPDFSLRPPTPSL